MPHPVRAENSCPICPGIVSSQGHCTLGLSYNQGRLLQPIVGRSHKKEIPSAAKDVVKQAGLLITGSSGKQFGKMYASRA